MPPEVFLGTPQIDNADSFSADQPIKGTVPFKVVGSGKQNYSLRLTYAPSGTAVITNFHYPKNGDHFHKGVYWNLKPSGTR